MCSQTSQAFLSLLWGHTEEQASDWPGMDTCCLLATADLYMISLQELHEILDVGREDLLRTICYIYAFIGTRVPPPRYISAVPRGYQAIVYGNLSTTILTSIQMKVISIKIVAWSIAMCIGDERNPGGYKSSHCRFWETPCTKFIDLVRMAAQMGEMKQQAEHDSRPGGIPTETDPAWIFYSRKDMLIACNRLLQLRRKAGIGN